VEQFALSTSLAVSHTKSRYLLIHWDAKNVSMPFSLITKETPEKYLGYTIGPEGFESIAVGLISRITSLLKEMPTDNCQHDCTIQIKSITMKCLLHISILSLVSYHIIKSCIDLNIYEKNQKLRVNVSFELSFD
jgi:hypothetical protein